MSLKKLGRPVGRAHDFTAAAAINASLLVATLFFAQHLLATGERFAAPFLNWMRILRETGLWNVFARIHDQYGPGSYVILAGANLLADRLAITPYAAFKLVQFSLLFTSGVVAAVLGRRLQLAVLFVLLQATTGLLFASVDIFFTPLLLIALWALGGRRHATFSASFAGACLIKYQPLVFAPILVACLGRRLLASWRRSPSDGLRLLVATSAPALAVLAATLVGFGASWFQSLGNATKVLTSFMSAYSFNAHWIATAVSQAVAGKLPAGGWTVAAQTTTDADVFASRALLVAVGLWLAATSWRRADSPENLYRFCAAFYLAYFIIHNNVHVNHLHPALVPLLLLAAREREWTPWLTFWGLMLSLNLLLMFAWPRGRVLWRVDLSLPFALLALAAFARFLWRVCKQEPQSTAPGVAGVADAGG